MIHSQFAYFHFNFFCNKFYFKCYVMNKRHQRYPMQLYKAAPRHHQAQQSPHLGQNALSQSNLYAGQYLVQFTDLNGCVKTDSIELFQPQELSSTVSSFFDYNGYEISCYEADDGQIDLTVFGGVQPYQYLWNNGYSDEDPNSLTSGYYSVSFNDLNNWMVSGPRFPWVMGPFIF